MDTNRKIDLLKYSAQFDNSRAVICQTETKLSKVIDDSEVNLPGYTVYRRDRDRCEDGVAIYCRSDIKSTALLDMSAFVEHCVMRLTLPKGDSTVICCVYRPPSARSEWLDHFYALMDSLSLHLYPLILTGNFNETLLVNASFAKYLKSNYHLSQHIVRPTRISKSTATLTDHLYTSHRSMVIESGVANLHL